MNVTTSRTVLGLLLPSVVICQSCTSFKTIDYQPSVSAQEQIQDGYRVRVIEVSGRQRDFTVTGVDDERIEGRTSDGADVRIEVGQVREIERRERSRAKTAGAIIGGLAAFCVMVAVFYGAPLAL